MTPVLIQFRLEKPVATAKMPFFRLVSPHFASNQRFSLTDKRFSLSDKRSSASKEHSSLSDRRSSETDKRSSMTEKRSSVTDKRSSVSEKRFSMTDKHSSLPEKPNWLSHKLNSFVDKPASFNGKPALAADKIQLPVSLGGTPAPASTSHIAGPTHPISPRGRGPSPWQTLFHFAFLFGRFGGSATQMKTAFTSTANWHFPEETCKSFPAGGANPIM